MDKAVTVVVAHILALSMRAAEMEAMLADPRVQHWEHHPRCVIFLVRNLICLA
jgi:hypothetical protein